MAVTNERPPHVTTIRDATPLRNATRQVWRALYQATMPTPSFVFCQWTMGLRTSERCPYRQVGATELRKAEEREEVGEGRL